MQTLSPTVREQNKDYTVKAADSEWVLNPMIGVLWLHRPTAKCALLSMLA